jgi:hypothetical protein
MRLLVMIVFMCVCASMSLNACMGGTPMSIKTMEGGAYTDGAKIKISPKKINAHGVLKLGEKHWLLLRTYGGTYLRREIAKLVSLSGLEYGLSLSYNRGEFGNLSVYGCVGVGALFSRRYVRQAGMRTNTATFLRIDILHGESSANISGEVAYHLKPRYQTRDKRARGLYSFSIRGSYKF